MTNRVGRLLVGLYYRTSPPVATVIARHEPLRMGVRGLLTILILAIEHPVLSLLMVGGGICSLGGKKLHPLKNSV